MVNDTTWLLGLNGLVAEPRMWNPHSAPMGATRPAAPHAALLPHPRQLAIDACRADTVRHVFSSVNPWNARGQPRSRE
jgi:hypothetical protein